MMGWYKRASRFVCDTLGRYHSNTGAVKSNSRISENSVCENVLKNNTLKKKKKNVLKRNSPFVDGSKVHSFKSVLHECWRGTLSSLNWIGFGFAIAAYVENTETVPYTRRRHFLLWRSYEEIVIGDKLFEKIKSEFEGKIMAPHHPDSIRVQKIGHDIVEVVKSQTAHLDEFESEFIVVDEPAIVNSGSAPGGKIVLFTGLLNQCKGDDEIATIIAHEVGHAVARHKAEDITKFIVLKLILSPLTKLSGIDDGLRISDVQRLPDMQRRELEADYIGLILMASAGYDPRVAPHVHKNLEEKFEGDEAREDFRTHHHPSGETRAQLLLQPKVMEEALSIYKEVLAQRGIEFRSDFGSALAD